VLQSAEHALLALSTISQTVVITKFFIIQYCSQEDATNEAKYAHQS
jgi:hypothetical protein